eukprot:454007-Amphidinium_carterae.2
MEQAYKVMTYKALCTRAIFDDQSDTCLCHEGSLLCGLTGLAQSSNISTPPVGQSVSLPPFETLT